MIQVVGREPAGDGTRAPGQRNRPPPPIESQKVRKKPFFAFAVAVLPTAPLKQNDREQTSDGSREDRAQGRTTHLDIEIAVVPHRLWGVTIKTVPAKTERKDDRNASLRSILREHSDRSRSSLGLWAGIITSIKYVLVLYNMCV